VSVETEKRIGNIYGFDGGNYAGNVYDTNSLSPTLRANSGGNTQPMIIENSDIIMIDTQSRTAKYRIRKLSPKECGRLMGCTDEDIDKMAAVNSNSQLYRQFGNSIVVNVMCAMFRNLNIKGVKPWSEYIKEVEE